MEQDYIGIIKKKLEDVYRNAGVSGPARGEKVDRDNRVAFIVSFFVHFPVNDVYNT